MVWVARALWASIGLSLVLIVSSAIAYGKMSSRVEQLGEQLKELAAKNEALRSAHDNLRAYVTVLMDRDPRGAPRVPEAIVFRGEIRDVSATSITILEPELGEPARKFTLPSNAEIILDGRPAKVADLRHGMEVAILQSGGMVTAVRARSKFPPHLRQS